MWNHPRDEIVKYRRTLSIIVLLVKNPILTEESFKEVRNGGGGRERERERERGCY